MCLLAILPLAYWLFHTGTLLLFSIFRNLFLQSITNKMKTRPGNDKRSLQTS